jgi:hypothetical protein
MLRSALIHHLPFIPNQFEPHYDWLVELKPELNPNNRSIMTWRVLRRIDFLQTGEQCVGQLIQPHRAFYLELNETQQLSQLRGTVQPVIKGKLQIIKRLDQQINLKVYWIQSEQLLTINIEDNLITCQKNITL